MKKCTKCKEEKNIDLFGKGNANKDKKSYICKSCIKLKRDLEKNYQKKYQSIYRSKNKEEAKKYRLKYQIENKFQLKELYQKYKKKRRLTDPLFNLTECMRVLIGFSLRKNGYNKKSKTYQILGCSYKEFKSYLESKFEPWMSWDNHGLYNGEFNYGWDIDHIIPISSAKTEEELIKLNHFSNLQPLCSKINRNIKRNKLLFINNDN